MQCDNAASATPDRSTGIPAAAGASEWG